MIDAVKLDAGQKHLMRLLVQGADLEGWAPVSAQVFPLMEKLPSALVVLERVGDDGLGRACLTTRGASVIDAMAWLDG